MARRPPPTTASAAPADRFAPPAVLEALLSSTADAIYLVDHEGRVRFANPAALAMLGYAEAELLGRDSHATIHHHHRDGSPYPVEECPLLRPRVTGETVRVEDDWFVRKDGSLVPVAYSSAPVATDDGRGAVVVFRDVRERRQAEELRRREAEERARAEELRASRARIVAATDAERRRLGRDIHDGVQQRLMNVALGVQRGADAVATAPDAARELLGETLEEVRATLVDLRELASGIHPSILTNRGLGAAVESLTARTPLPVRAEIPERRYPPAIESAAYFSIAEALANVAKHAGADHAWVRADEQDGRLVVTVRDDGRGGAGIVDGHGLQGLQDRVRAAGGDLRVERPAGGGTTVVAELPVPA